MASDDPQLIDSIYRLYRNSDRNIIGIHQISVFEERQINPRPSFEVKEDRLKSHAYTNFRFERIDKIIGTNRTIASVTILGKYDDFEVNTSQTDYNSVSYIRKTDKLVISLRDLPTIGDTL